MTRAAVLREDNLLSEPGLDLPKDWSKWPRIVVLSSHSDDAAFSLAGHLFYLSRSAKKICLLTCFSRSAFTQNAAYGDVNSTTELRKLEDACYARALGPLCTPAWLDLPDAPLRGYALQEVRRSGELTADDHSLACRLKEQLPGFMAPGAAIFAPLGIGGHIDHRIVHEAAFALAESGRFPMIFYEDMPYSAACEESEIRRHILSLENRLNCSFTYSSCSTRCLLDIKKSAARCYPSQVREETLRNIFDASLPISRYTFERVWQLRPRGRGEERI
jgi:LmbE family N-acetylglucosaminyl deacetylase